MAINREPMIRTSEQTVSDLDRTISMVRLPLRRYCEFLSSSRHDAEDLVQTTLLKALPVLQGTKHHPNLPALLRRIAKNTWLDEVRKQGYHHLCKPEELQSTICVGMAASFGAVLLIAGANGKRFALPNSEVMIHQPLGGARGQASDIKIHADWILKTREKINALLARHTGQPVERIAADTDRDRFMSAEEAKDYGLIDDVITR